MQSLKIRRRIDKGGWAQLSQIAACRCKPDFIKAADAARCEGFGVQNGAAAFVFALRDIRHRKQSHWVIWHTRSFGMLHDLAIWLYSRPIHAYQQVNDPRSLDLVISSKLLAR